MMMFVWYYGDKEVSILSPKEKANTERINVFFSLDALQKLKDEAMEKGLSVSGLVRMIVLQYLATQK